MRETPQARAPRPDRRRRWTQHCCWCRSRSHSRAEEIGGSWNDERYTVRDQSVSAEFQTLGAKRATDPAESRTLGAKRTHWDGLSRAKCAVPSSQIVRGAHLYPPPASSAAPEADSSPPG